MKQEYIDYIKDAYTYALKNEYVRSKRAFAKLIKVNNTTLTAAINGKYSGSGEVLYLATKKWRESIEDKTNTVTIEKKVVNEPPSIREVVLSPSHSLRAELASRMLCVTSEWHLTNKRGDSIPIPKESAVKLAIEYADELIKQLKKDAKEEH